MFPDFLGCVSCGKDFAEAEKMGKEALEFHIESIARDGDDIPLESDLSKVNEFLIKDAETQKIKLGWFSN